MQAATTDLAPLWSTELPTVWYTILGVPVSVASDLPEVLTRIEESYSAFRSSPGDSDGTLALQLTRASEEADYQVRDSQGYTRCWADAQAALLDLLDRLVQGVLARLHAQGVYAIHASAAVYQDQAIILAGRSGQGKTTLALGLLRRGLGLLSDEFAIVEPANPRILPYRRSLHIRPDTPEFIPELDFLRQVPRYQIGGGNEWSVDPQTLERAIPGCLASAAPLRYVILLEGVPQPNEPPALIPAPAALATMELLRNTWAVSIDFAGGLRRIGRLLEGVACATLRVGQLEPTLDCIVDWMEARRG